jgi:hypothetical protein
MSVASPVRPDLGQLPPPAPKKKSSFARKVTFGIIGLFILVVAISSLGSTPTKVPAIQESAAPVQESAAPEPSEAPEPTTAPEVVEPVFTVSQENAIESANGYLDYAAFSESGLIEQLSSEYGEGFSKADAVFAVNHIDVNWNEQAAKSAQSYLDFGSFSRQGLIEQLESEYGEGFTHSQAVYGVNQTGL